MTKGWFERFDPQDVGQQACVPVEQFYQATNSTKDVKVPGVKYDSGKNRMELVDALAVEGLAAVLTFGAKKYSANNWRGGMEYTRLIGALKRHLSSIEKGEDIDPESGLPHIDHLGCGWMFLSNFMKTRPDLDDRWKAK